MVQPLPLSHKQNLELRGSFYNKVGWLGCGYFGEVYLYKNASCTACSPQLLSVPCLQCQVAIKFSRKDATTFHQDNRTLLNKLLEMKDTNVMSISQITLEPNQTMRTLVIVMEYCSGGDMCNLISVGASWTVSMDYSRQILKGLCYIHDDQKMVHTDVKPLNILLTNLHETGVYQTIKLADIDDGIALKGNDTGTDEVPAGRGSPRWRSPELLKNKDFNIVRSGRKTDIWSFGCAMHQLFYGCVNITAPGITQITLEWKGAAPGRVGKFISQRTFFETPLRKWVNERKMEMKNSPQLSDCVSHQRVCKPLQDVFDKCFEFDPDDRPEAKTLISMPPFDSPTSPLIHLLASKEPPEFTVRPAIPYRLQHRCDRPGMDLWHGVKDGNVYTAFNIEDQVEYDDELREPLRTNPARTLKLLDKQCPINLYLCNNGQPIPSQVSFAVLSDLITTLRLCYVDFQMMSLPEFTLPNLTILQLLGSANVTIAKDYLKRYPKLVCLGLHYCSYGQLEDNFLSCAASLKRFSFGPQMCPEQCQRDPNAQTAGRYYWLRKFLQDNTAFVEMKSLNMEKINEETVTLNLIPEVDPGAVQHTLECPVCSAWAYENCHGRDLLTPAGHFNVQETFDRLQNVGA